MTNGEYHCIVVGGGPAGLTCALYMARFNRRVLVVSSEDQRARHIPCTHNLPGHPEGITGPDLIARCREHAQKYGAEVVRGTVCRVDGTVGAFHALLEDGRDFRGHNVVFATGSWDMLPDIPDAERYYGHGLRVCPICDGYEANGKRLAIFGTGDYVARHALFLTTFTDHITVMLNGAGRREDIRPDLLGRMEDLHIGIVEGKVVEVLDGGDEIRGLRTEDGTLVEVDRAYAAVEGCNARTDIARALGVTTDADGFIKVDPHQCTNVEGVYAVGDAVNVDYAQIIIAMGQAAVAAIHIQNRYFSEG